MNVLVIMCDQLRYDALSCHGNQSIETPHLDKLAKRSVRFHNAFCQAPLCGPTRHTLATGLYPYEHGVISNKHLPNEGMQTIAHAVRENGVRPHCFGHMHWQRLPGTEGHVFMDHGYEEYRAISRDEGPEYEKHKQELMWQHVSSMRTGGVSPQSTDDYYGTVVLSESIKQLQEYVNNGDSFLCWTSYNEPHPPFFAPKEFYRDINHSELPIPVRRPDDASPMHSTNLNRQKNTWTVFNGWDHRQMKAGYFGLVRMVDSFIGQLLDEIDRLNLWDNTAIIFTVDHGEMMGDHNLYSKFVFYEPAVHIPMMIYHPDFEPGDCHELVEHTDIFPTICELTQTPCPDNIQGKSLLPLLADKDNDNWRQYTISQQDNDVMIRTKQYKLNCYNGTPGELFDLESDPNEFYNLIDGEQHQHIKEELLASFSNDHPDFYSKNQAIIQANRLRRNKTKPALTYKEVP